MGIYENCAQILSCEAAIGISRVLNSDGSHHEKRGKGKPACIDDEIPFEIPKARSGVEPS